MVGGEGGGVNDFPRLHEPRKNGFWKENVELEFYYDQPQPRSRFATLASSHDFLDISSSRVVEIFREIGENLPRGKRMGYDKT